MRFWAKREKNGWNEVKCETLDQAKRLQNTIYKEVGIGPDQTKKQKQAQIKLTAEVNHVNSQMVIQMTFLRKQTLTIGATEPGSPLSEF